MIEMCLKVITGILLLLVIGIVLVLGAPLDETEITTDSIINATNCPRIVSRAEWGARTARDYDPLSISPTPYVVAHHGGIPHYCHDEETCARIVRSYQDFHIDIRKWSDIGYNFVIGGDGNVYEGRGWDRFGAHAPGYNGQGIGICIIGDYTSRLPNETSLQAFRSLIDCGISLGKIRSDYKLIGHRQGRDTECPGETFFQYLKTWSHWTDHPVPLWANSIATVQEANASKVLVSKTPDITDTKIWFDLAALGDKESTDPIGKTDEKKAENKDEENVVDTGSSGDKVSTGS